MIVSYDSDLTTKDVVIGAIAVLVIIVGVVAWHVYGTPFIGSLISGVSLEFQPIILQAIELIPILCIMLLLISQPMWLIGRMK